MKPSIDLDSLIAEKIFGTPVHTSTESYELSPLGLHPGTKYIREGERIPHYSGDIIAAWKVVEHFKIKHEPLYDGDNTADTMISAVIRMEDGRWMARYDAPCELEHGYYERNAYPDGLFAIGDSAPHAICLAALKAIGHNF